MGSSGFLVGVLVGSAATAVTLILAFADDFHWRHKLDDDAPRPRPSDDDDGCVERCERHASRQEAIELGKMCDDRSVETMTTRNARKRASEEEEVELGESDDCIASTMTTLNDGNGRRPLHDDGVNGRDGQSGERRDSFCDSDGGEPSTQRRRDSCSSVDSGTKVEVITREEWQANDEIIRQTKDFDEQILSKLESKEEMALLLRRTRAVNALAHRLTCAKDEKSCFEAVSQLLVPLFHVDGCAFALRKDSEHIVFKHIVVNNPEYPAKMGFVGGRMVKPMHETAAALCATTLEQYYCPSTKDSPFPAQRMVHRTTGLNTLLVTPILMNGDKFAGCIITGLVKEDALKGYDRTLINDVATMLGSSIYAKRLRVTAESSNKVSREMLHSMIPPKVIEKIECFWDETSTQYQSRRSSSSIASLGNSSFVNSLFDESDKTGDDDSQLAFGDLDLEEDFAPSSKASNLKRKHDRQRKRQHLRQSITAKVNFFAEMNKANPELGKEEMIIDTSAMELTSTQRALYAETVPNVCIIFTDIVGFSRLSLDMKPIKVMDMLQDLFSRFDNLCDRHGVQKLETIGDAYICTAGLFDEGSRDADCNSNLEQAAANALEMAKEMVREARRTSVKRRDGTTRTLEIRVGMHVGEITCGVLGERLPKFTVFGSAVNLAARMEQAGLPSRIRVTEDFHRLLPDREDEDWQEKEVIPVKNMGEVGTYLLNPYRDDPAM